MFSPPGLQTHASHSEPESATHSRERRRVAMIVREMTAYIDSRFNELSDKLDLATAGLAMFANRELLAQELELAQPDIEPSPLRATLFKTDYCEEPLVCQTSVSVECAKTLHFDLCAEERHDVGIQTCGEWEPLAEMHAQRITNNTTTQKLANSTVHDAVLTAGDMMRPCEAESKHEIASLEQIRGLFAESAQNLRTNVQRDIVQIFQDVT